MARGNRRSGNPGEEVVNLFVQVPPELRFLVDQYKIDMRIPSLSEAIRRLLESHPALTETAQRIYNKSDTSPLVTPKGIPLIVGLLLWLVYFTATYVVVKFLIRGAVMHFAGHPTAQGLAAVTEA